MYVYIYIYIIYVVHIGDKPGPRECLLDLDTGPPSWHREAEEDRGLMALGGPPAFACDGQLEGPQSTHPVDPLCGPSAGRAGEARKSNGIGFLGIFRGASAGARGGAMRASRHSRSEDLLLAVLIDCVGLPVLWAAGVP